MNATDSSTAQVRPRPDWRKSWSQLRIKITAPYILLAILIAFAATFITTRYIVSSVEERFQKSLQDAAHRAADAMVLIERKHLATIRSVANSEGLPEAVASKDAPLVRQRASLIALNDGVNCLEVIAADYTPLLTMHRERGGGPTDYRFDLVADYGTWPLVNKILSGAADETGDKYTDVVQAPWGWTFYIAGPIKQEERVVGVVLVGTYLDTLVSELDPSVLARITLYSPEGTPLASTLTTDLNLVQLTPDFVQQSLQAEQRQRVMVREVNLGGRPQAEVFTAWVVRRAAPLRGGQILGLMSAALPSQLVANASTPARNWLIALFSAATVLILATGAWLATRLVRPIHALVNASQKVAEGDLSTSVIVDSSDEIGDLAQAFNIMTVGLRERQRERDLFGRAVSPEVRDALLAGKVSLGGELLHATVLFSDIVGFTSMSEQLSPPEVVSFLNEYLTEMERPIRENGGTINKYVGDAIVAIFGAPIGHRDDATRAVRAAVGMCRQLAALNERRQARGEPPLAHGIGLSTGSVVAGAVGSPERLEYTVIGDSVNVASRLEALTRQLKCQILVTEEVIKTLESLKGLEFEDKGEVHVKGRVAPVRAFELKV